VKRLDARASAPLPLPCHNLPQSRTPNCCTLNRAATIAQSNRFRNPASRNHACNVVTMRNPQANSVGWQCFDHLMQKSSRCSNTKRKAAIKHEQLRGRRSEYQFERELPNRAHRNRQVKPNESVNRPSRLLCILNFKLSARTRSLSCIVVVANQLNGWSSHRNASPCRS
jgi:hypothetical protein